jgi:hypothetical protein
MDPKYRAERPRSSNRTTFDPDFLDPTVSYRREPANLHRRWREEFIEEDRSFRLDVLRAAGLVE